MDAPCNPRTRAKLANPRTAKPRNLNPATASPQQQAASLVASQLRSPLLVPFAPFVREVLFRDVERAVLPLDITARKVLADHAEHGELQAAEQQD